MITVYTTAILAEAEKVKVALGQPINNVIVRIDRPHPKSDDHPAEVWDVDIVDVSQTDIYKVHAPEIAFLMNAFVRNVLEKE